MDDIPQVEIAEVARSIVASIAPQELLLYRMHSEEFFKNPAQALSPPKMREDAMGFGAGEAVQLVTPWVLNALVPVIGAEVVLEGARAVVRRLFETSERGAASLSPEQLKRVHDIALANAGPDPALARRIADGIVAALLPPASVADTAKPSA